MPASLMRLGQVAAKLGENAKQIQRAVDEGYVPRPEKKGQHEPWGVAAGMIRFYRDKASKVTQSKLEDSARTSKAEADMAEMALGRIKGTLCLRSDYLDNYADAIAQGVRNVTRIKELSKALREKVFSAIRDVSLPEPSTETK